jgi:LmbE family N-acetylglucosaminyl deacetylase
MSGLLSDEPRVGYIGEADYAGPRAGRQGRRRPSLWASERGSASLVPMNVERAMVIFAHPDDAEFGTAGTVASWTRSGIEVAYVCVTDGSAGSNEPGVVREELAEIRLAEQRAACDVLGVEDLTVVGIQDGYVELTLGLRRALTREVRRFRPDILVAPDPTRYWDDSRSYINHIDHRTVGQACMAVANPDSSTRPMFPELLAEGFEPHELPYLWIGTFGAEADTYVDITETIETKIQALRCHKSQIHDWPVDEWIRDRARERAEGQGFEYAEAFKTFKLREHEEERRGQTDETGAGDGGEQGRG